MDVGITVVFDREARVILRYYENNTALYIGTKLAYESDFTGHTTQIEVARMLAKWGYVKLISQYNEEKTNDTNKR